MYFWQQKEHLLRRDIHDIRRNFYGNIIACNRNNTPLCITMEVHQVSTVDFILQ